MPVATQNLFLNSLSAALRDEILAHCETVELPAGVVLCGPDAPMLSAYFVTSGVAAAVTLMPDGSTTEVGIMGREGFLGIVHLLGTETGSTRIFMQIAGGGYRIPMATMRELFRRSEEMRDRTLELVQNYLVSLRQMAACSRLHTTEARLARWLLMVQERVGSNTLQIKQESLAAMLGSRRTTVTVAAAVMKKNGWIGYSRGRIQILNRPAMEAAACVCYPVVQRLFRNLCEAESTVAMTERLRSSAA